MRASVAIGLWTLLVTLSSLVSPPARPDQGAWVMDLLMGRWEGIDPTVVAHFQLMGLWPIVFAALLAPDLRAPGRPAWPFVLGSMAMGAFVLLPWFALRHDEREVRPEGALERMATSPITGGVVGALSLGLFVWALRVGDVGVWEQARGTEQFMYVMTLDFGVLWLTSLLVAKEQGEARGDPRWRWAGIPLLGSMIWVRLRQG